MNTAVALCRIAILLLIIACVAWIANGQLYQRRVCPTVRKYPKRCKNVPDKCTSDEDCPDGGERCCPTENECFLSCQKTVIPTGCPIPIDLALLLDSSGSIGRKNWKKVQKFAKDVVDIYDISEKGTHIAILPYSTNPVIEIKFNKYKGAQLNGVNIKRDIDNFKLQKGLTFIDKALKLANEELFTEEAGMRKNIRKVALVLTDGIQTKNRGPYTELFMASDPLKMKGIDIYSLGVGSDIEVMELIQTATVPDFVFSAANFDDLSQKVTEITDAQCKACDKTLDIVFGIPDSTTIPKPTFNQIKKFFVKLSSLFQLSATGAHYGIVRYSDSADIAAKLDQYYNLHQIQAVIKSMTQQGSGVDVNKAIRSAADHLFTIYGGVRQTVPKTLVIFIPQPETVDQDAIKAATEKLKSMGVRILFVGLQDNIDTAFYARVASQPSARYLLTGFDIKELTEVASYEAVDTICKARYGKCPISGIPPECPEGEPDGECKIDDDCKSDESMCCYDACGSSTCITRIKNCFVTMDVAFAIDSSAAVNDADFKKVQTFAKNLVHHFADSENSIHFGLVQYGATAQTIVDFNKFLSDPKIKEVIDKLVKGNDGTRRVDLALQKVKKDVFSLEGGMRQGHPRYVIFITGGDTDPSSASLAKASEELRGLGVEIIAIGINSGVSKGFLNNLATNPRFIHSLGGVDELTTIRPAIENEICKEKPGKCPPTDRTVPLSRDSCGGYEGLPIIPCGITSDRPGGKSSDWDCPGEQKCCIGSDGCAICTEPPNECRGQYDLTLVMENSASVSPKNFQKMKDFAKELVSAFFISELGTRVASVTYGDSALVNFKLNTVPGVNRKVVYNEIDKLAYQGGSGNGVAKALEQAVKSIYTKEGGTRDLNNKSLVIMGTGKFLSAKRAALMANKLRQEQVDVFLVPIGGEGDVAGVRNVVSKKIENNAFMTTSFDALRPHLRALTKAICDGAQKLQPCKLPLDVVFGIPTSGSLGGQFGEIKDIFKGLLKFFIVNNRLAHFGIIQYSNNAAMTLKIDSMYNRDALSKYIDNILFSGNGFNVEAAFTRAADHAFTIFGGVRQTVPKTFVIFVPREASTPIQNVLAAAQNLKRMGVKVIVLGLNDVPQLNQYRQLAASQPSSKFFFGETMDEISGSIYNIRETICKGRYGRCPPEPTDKCTNVAETCQLDMDCGEPSQMCCAEPGCQRSCTTKLDNCFVNMEIAIAIDNSPDGAGGELNQVKQFVSNLVRPLATSENSMRLSLMTFGTESQTLARFRERNPESVLQQKIAAISQSSGAGRDLNNAFQAMRFDHFSLEGGMRQGHPRVAIFVVGADAPNNFVDAANELKSMDRMRVMAIGTKQSVSDGLLSAIASAPNLVFKANSPADLNGLQGQIRGAFCQPKPGKCPPAPNAPGTGCPATVPARYIPCKNSDWPCPGEQKCCRDPSGCFEVCRVAPRECPGVHDLALLLETNDAVGESGFNKVKSFAKELIDGFSIADSGTRVSVISYGDKAKVDSRFNTIINSNKERVKARIDRIPYRGGGPSLTSEALQEAFQEVYKFAAGSRGPAVNKSVLIISQGKYGDAKKASRYASQLQQQGIDVYQVAIGGNEDIPAIRGVASKKQHKTVFITSSYDALRPHLRAVTDRICEGAEKPYICKEPLDLIFGIPVGKELGGSLGGIKTFLTSFTKRFVIGNRGTHIGMIPYSDKAVLDKRIDEMYNPSEINEYINGLTHQGNGYNLTKALRVATNYGFNVYGGTRPSAPKTYVLIVPGAIPPSDERAVQQASRKLKSVGVRLVIFALGGGSDKRSFQRLTSQPSRKYLTYGNFDDFIAASEQTARTICRGRYGTCDENPPPPPDCPDPPVTKCEDDSDCADPDQACCETACAGSTECAPRVKNCFVNMDIALAIDTSDSANLPAIKEFAKKLVTAVADTENAIHFSVMGYADTPTTMSTLGEYLSKQQTHGMIDAMSVGAGEPRVDLALAELRKAHFSLEGGVRQGHPRFALFITSKGNSPSSGDLAAPTQALSDVNVNIAAVGTNGAVGSFVDSLVSKSEFAYKANSPAELQGLITGMKLSLCPEKPGKCPPVEATCPSPGGDVPAKFIPCGESAGKPGRSDKENDWDCPGEQRCCKDPTGCHQVCRDPPNECHGTHDLAFLIDSSNDVGEDNFKVAKKFVNDVIDAFKIGMRDTHIALINYGAQPKVEIKFDTFVRPSKDRIKSVVDRARFSGNGPSSTAAALQQAVDIVYTEGNGAREGVNKSLVIISPGQFTNPAGAIRLAGLLKLNQVDVFAVPIGKAPDVATIRKVISKKQSKTAFMTTTYLALRPHVRGLTKAICDGAEKIKICDKKMDVVFGIPTSNELGKDFEKVKDFYNNMLQLFKVNNRKVHVGLIPYSSSAKLSLHLDQVYDRDTLMQQVQNLKLSGNGYNVRDALRVAADHAFTMFGGTRPSAPKTFVLFVPGTVSGNGDEIQAAAAKLKSIGVRLMVMAVKDKNSYDLFSTATSQPAQKHYMYGDYDLLGASVYDAVETICKAKYGKCPAYQKPAAECPVDAEDECTLDENCGGIGDGCCDGSCGKRVCGPLVQNCFVAMDVGIAVDATSAIPDAEFDGVKRFVTQIIHASADSENNIHYGLLKYGLTPQLMASFRQFESDAKFKKMITNMKKTGDSDRRLDYALQGIKSDIFSLTGGMRQGRPRYAIVVVSGPNSAESGDLKEASKLLRALGVNVIAVGSNGNVDNALLEQVASDPKLVFKAAGPDDFNAIWNNIQNIMCTKKPGTCPPVAATCSAPGSDVPAELIPCGDSEGKTGRSDKQNDWDCPGTTRCCKDPTGCHSICREPPSVCKGIHDLTILMDNSANSGREGFEKIKAFSQGLVDAFDIGNSGTRVAVISYDDNAKINFRFNSPATSSKGTLKSSIQSVPYMGGPKAEVSNALKLALQKVYKLESGMRPNSNKSLVIIGSGKFANPSRAARFAGELKMNLVDIFVMPIGYDTDLPAVTKVASPLVDNNVFMTTSPEALRPHVRALTKRICDGAEKPKVCEIPMDVVYGIPTAVSVGDGLEEVKSFFKSMTRQFRVSNRKTHIGLIPYSDSAKLSLNIDQQYSPNGIINAIEKIEKEGSGLNVARAIQVAADHAFTVYGGTRPTAPKTFVLYVPGPAVGTANAIQAAAAKLKSVGVKLMVVGLEGVDKDLYRLASSQPHQKYFLNGDYDHVHSEISGAVDTICKGRYGKCPAYKPPKVDDCGASPVNECDVDGDCADPNHACCEGNCGRTCTGRVKNCFVAMDIAIAMDATSTIPDQDFENQKRIATHIVNSIANAENSIHYGLLKYGATSQVLANFNRMASDAAIKQDIKNMQKTGDPERRIDTALATISSGIFSLEGGMRQGHPRNVIFFTSGTTATGSDDLVKSSRGLRDLGVKITAIGVGNADEAFLKQLAGDGGTAIKISQPDEVDTVWSRIQESLCPPKPKVCPPVSQSCKSPGAEVPLEYIPCGESAGKAGQSQKQNDWDCPGEQKCCRDPSGCHSICRPSPNYCANRAHDLAILLERSDATTEHGFDKAKAFAQDLADAFYVADRGTHVSVATYGPTAEVQFRFNYFRGPQMNNGNVRNSIGRIHYAGGASATASGALNLAVNDIFTDRSGAREGVNKSLVIIGSGQFLDSARAIALSASLKQNLVDVFSVPIGPNYDVATQRKFASPNANKNIFITSSYDALKPHVRAVTKAICDGAVKIRKCDRPVDVYFGIPNANFLSPQFGNIRNSFVNLLRQLVVTNRLVHVGIMQYSDSASVLINLDRTYNRDALEGVISREMGLYGSGLNLAELFNKAADHGFTIYGGTRQTAPKVLVVFIPGPVSSSPEEIKRAADKLKGLGVRIVVLGLNNAIDKGLYSTIVTQPASKYLLTADTYNGLSLALSAAQNRICNAKYGRCPKPPEPPAECPDDAEPECSQDRDCKKPGDLCCKGGCTRTCQKGIENCFVPMDIAFALDVSETTTSDQLTAMKDFVRETMRSFASSENDIHFSLMQYAGNPVQLTQGFRRFPSEGDIKNVLDDVRNINDPTRRVDLALSSAKRNIFSLEGRMRHGHPKYIIFLTSSATSVDSTDLPQARRPLDVIGVKTIAVGVNKDVDPVFLQQLASENGLVFQADSPDTLPRTRQDIVSKFCDKKPGKCIEPLVPPDPAVCASQPKVPLQFIPCGDSLKGKEGRSQRQNDWDCPGESKCCKDPDTGCHNVCRYPPIVCNKVKDLELVVESSQVLGEGGFARMKQFLQYFVEAFGVSRSGSHVGMITYGSRGREAFRLNAYGDTKGVQEGIRNARYMGGFPYPSEALVTALDVSFTRRGGARPENVNKSLVLFTTGKFQKPDRAATVAFQLKEKLIDVYAVAIGDNPEIDNLRNVVSRPLEDNIFMVSSPEALRAQARALVKRVCDGAEKNYVVIGPNGPPGLAGLRGKTGPPGRRGYIGEPGPAGDKGPKGGDGPPGNPGNPGPQGPPGPMKVKTIPGPKGPVVVPQITYGGAGDLQRQGDPGPPGRLGSRGIDGPPGIPGARGAPGERGPMGMIGLIGPPGQTGRPGEDGDPGSSGREGPRGDPGRKGPPGHRGKSGLAGRDGHIGRNGRRGRKGDRGGDGVRGLNGVVGLNGVDGIDGERGQRGQPGMLGDAGPAGLTGPRGSSGRAGSQGSPGINGPAGPPGPRGPKGVPGRSGNKGPMGYSGETGITGVPGLKGMAGKNGEAGEQGNTGPKGANGDIGGAGEQGPVGETGARGMAGNSGGRGARGDVGDAGKVGGNGEVGTKGGPGKPGDSGAQGQPGPVGKRGAPGQAGQAGQPGSPGKRGMVGSQGFQGQQGGQGAKGSTGETGARGGSGNKGDAGETGGSGATGPNGERGARGRAGNPGKDGGRGVPGDNGDDGRAGEKGPPGARGPSGPRGLMGAKGKTGKQGKIGVSGKAGPEGVKGEQGVVGGRGLPGVAGEAGGAGEIGGAGPIGEPGGQGAAGKIGARGLAGNAGSDGPKGNTGVPGNDGRNGKDGPVGGRGQVGAVGEAGKVGEAGSTGRPGVTGVSGAAGPTGADGRAGSTGSPGLPGDSGKNGGKGQRGEQGKVGARGEGGPDGGKGPDGGDGERGPLGTKGMPGERGDDGGAGDAGNGGEAGQRGDQGGVGKTGQMGLQGTTGPTGIQGLIGGQGQKGVRGERGETGFIGSTGLEGAAGSKGPKGGIGNEGPSGEQGGPGGLGMPGPPGPSGPGGNAGKLGPNGTPGQKGPPGDAGAAGDLGEEGETGKDGTDGTNGGSGEIGVAGLIGPSGLPGESGPGGVRGGVGLPGNAGNSGILGIKGENGAAGSDGKPGPSGPAGIVGEEGKLGSTGIAGADGAPGTAGSLGAQGKSGRKGVLGDQGKQGLQGAQGTKGPGGAVGQRGSTGLEGLQGVVGAAGAKGNAGEAGTPGSQGEGGSKGNTGSVGQKGDRGVPGRRGRLGAPGPKGTFGALGPPGPLGLAGDRGTNGEPGAFGPPGRVGPPGPSGVNGILGSKGDRGNVGEEGKQGRPGPPGPPGPPGTVSSAWTSQAMQNFELGAQKTPYRLYQSRQDARQKIESGATNTDLFGDIVSLSYEIQSFKRPTGSKNFPAKTCKDLHMCHPNLRSGNYWIDPNEGIPDDAINVYCDFETQATCIYPLNNTKVFESPRRKWYSGSDQYKWFGKELHGLASMKYSFEPSQLVFLRILSDRARQNITYHCRNSVAWYNKQTKDYRHSIKIMGDNGITFHASSSNKFRPNIVKDDCHIKDGRWRQTVISVDTSKPYRLPISDIAMYDIGDRDEEFGVDIGPVCFS